MANIWFISDTHFGHKNIIAYENRPFSSTEEMDEAMIENWNRLVKPKDTIYHLGDVFLCGKERQQDIARRLSGKKIVRFGNHDKISAKKFTDMGFEQALKTDIEYEGLFIASHYPIENPALPNLHGHVHSKISHLDQTTHKCVSVELTDYAPVHVDDILAWAKRAKEKFA